MNDSGRAFARKPEKASITPEPSLLATTMSVLMFGVVVSDQILARTFPDTIDLAALDGTNGLKIDGEGVSDQSGRAVSDVGDINGDGVDDFVIGAGFADPNGSYSGRSYVVFGQNKSTQGSFASPLQLALLNGTTGFKIDGETASSFSGDAVSAAGDINGDGFDDLLVGADGADRSYVIFGRSGTFSSPFQLADLDGTNGFKMIGETGQVGYSVSSAGDINGDGVDDVVIGNPTSSQNGAFSGRSYVVFGRILSSQGAFEPQVHLANLDGKSGFKIDGAMDDFSGASVSSAGDINGDGIDDLVIGARWAPDGNQFGRYYVVFGRNVATQGPFISPFQLSTIDGTNGFKLEGEREFDGFGDISVSNAGDVNDDGIDDLIIGASRADPNGVAEAGRSYVVFGKIGGFAASISLGSLDGSNGFALNGDRALDESGGSVSNAGDVNGDGIADIVIGARLAGGGDAGRSYVVFGRAGGFPPEIELSDLDGATGFRILGETTGDNSGRPVSAAGDVNGDGFDDLIVGASLADPNGNFSGRSFIIFGGSSGPGLTPSIEIDSEPVQFGDVEIGLTEIASLRIDNLGDGSLSIFSLEISGDSSSDFAINDDDCTSMPVEPGMSCTINLSYTPSQIGQSTATLQIVSNALLRERLVPLLGSSGFLFDDSFETL